MTLDEHVKKFFSRWIVIFFFHFSYFSLGLFLFSNSIFSIKFYHDSRLLIVSIMASSMCVMVVIWVSPSYWVSLVIFFFVFYFYLLHKYKSFNIFCYRPLTFDSNCYNYIFILSLIRTAQNTHSLRNEYTNECAPFRKQNEREKKINNEIAVARNTFSFCTSEKKMHDLKEMKKAQK